MLAKLSCECHLCKCELVTGTKPERLAPIRQIFGAGLCQVPGGPWTVSVQDRKAGKAAVRSSTAEQRRGGTEVRRNRGEEEQRRGETEDRRNRGEERQTGETSLLSFTGHTLRRSGVELTRPSSPASPASSDCTSPRGETPTVPLLPADQLPAGAPATDLVIRRLLPQLLHLPQLARLVPGLGILVGLVDDEYARVVQRRVLSRTW